MENSLTNKELDILKVFSLYLVESKLIEGTELKDIENELQTKCIELFSKFQFYQVHYLSKKIKSSNLINEMAELVYNELKGE